MKALIKVVFIGGIFLIVVDFFSNYPAERITEYTEYTKALGKKAIEKTKLLRPDMLDE